jgi:ADP-ribosylglycohydrolase
MAGWDQLDGLFREELKQRGEEGCDVSGFAERAAKAGGDVAQLNQLYDELMTLQPRPDFPYVEPSDLNGIHAAQPPAPSIPQFRDCPDAADRFRGAWLGRCAGCALGKPVEAGDFMGGGHGNPGWKNVQLWFEGADAWPIAGYTPEHSRAEADPGIRIGRGSLPCTREHIHYMQTDDDIRYTVLGLVMLEERGLDFDTWDVAKLWHNRLTYGQVCTAETQAYLNFSQVTAHMDGQRPDDWRERLAWVPMYRNPYREWIGAQIRADGWAYAAAGNPELAAELAWRDASLSHVKNGVYGEMFAAAMIAAAFVDSDPERIVAAGLAQIPQRSRLAEAIGQALAIARSATDQVDLVSRIWDAFSHYHPVHTINNAALVAASLVYARGDFATAIATAVLGGWDTDCNGATVGSIMGAALGAAGLPGKWIDPLNDTLYAEIPGFHPIAISECAVRTREVWRRCERNE